MSRASAAAFSDFFPTAPRAAKNRARERERAKSRLHGSPSLEPAVPPVDATAEPASRPRSRDEAAPASAPALSASTAAAAGAAVAPGGSELGRDAAAVPPGEDADLQGDLLNCVRSASSHTSAASSVFSAAAQNAGPSAAANLSNLTPLTNDASSPVGQTTTSPRRSKPPTRTPSSLDHVESQSPKHVPPPPDDAPNATPDETPATMAPPECAQARDPSRPKGTKCVYDPQLDSSGVKPKPKVKYKDIGWVCIPFCGERHLSSALSANMLIGR